MEIALQIHHSGKWHDAAIVTFDDPDAGINGASQVSYNIDYFVEHGSIEFADGRPARDHRSLSVSLPVDLVNRRFDTWPSFLLDLLPQGHARRTWAKAWDWTRISGRPTCRFCCTRRARQSVISG